MKMLRVDISLDGGNVTLEIPPKLVEISEEMEVEVEISRDRPASSPDALVLRGVVYSVDGEAASASAHGMLIRLTGSARPEVEVGDVIYLKIVLYGK